MSEPYPAAIAAGWHPVATLAQLGAKPLARRLMDQDLVVFASAEGPAVLYDRCPHRLMPLSKGRLHAGRIVCSYHGWAFDGRGRCRATPGAAEPAKAQARSLPAVSRAGLVWTSLADKPAPFPALAPELEREGLDTFWWAVPPSRARILDAVENLLDPAHPHYLHPWMVRSPTRRRTVDVTVTTHATGGEARYIENARASAFMPRLLEGLRVASLGRYFAPTCGQVAFEGPEGLTLAITVIFTPESRDVTRPYAHFATPRGRAPAWAKRAALIGLHIPVLRQDRRALRDQAEAIERSGHAPYAMGPLDVLAPSIWRLANGEAQAPSVRQFTLEL